MIAQVTIDDKDLELKIPLEPSEITFSEFCDFRDAELKFIEANEDRDKNDPEQILLVLADAVATICGDAVKDLPASSSGISLDKLIDEGYQLTIGDEVGLLELYAHLISVLRAANYSDKVKPDQIPFYLDISHKDKVYRVRAANASRVMRNKPLTVGEAIEVQEYRRRYAQQVKRALGDGSALDFTLGLSEFAILVKGKNERLPTDELERENWIAERRELLADLPLTQVMRVRFFFDSRLAQIDRRQQYRFWKDGPPSSGQAAKTKEGRDQQRRRKELARQAWQVTGFRVFYQIGVEERWFEGSESTPYRSVFYADFRTFVANYCLKLSRL